MSGQMPVADTDIEKLRRYHAELSDFIAKIDADANPLDRVTRHFRRHLPLYAFAAIIALLVILVPTTNERGTNQESASSLTNPDSPSATADSTGGNLPGTVKNPNVAGGPGQSAGGLPGTKVPQAPGVGKVAIGTGKTIGGFDCKPGVRQIPWSTYAPPCVAKFIGNNGGNTYRGVDAKTITIAIRKNAIDAGDATDTQNAAQGRATRAQALELLNKWSGWFAKTMDLYGRTLKFVRFNSRVSNGVDEAQSKNQDGACNDATNIASSVKAFGDIGYGTSYIETQPFSACAKQSKIFVPFGASYFPESGVKDSYANWDPYVWHVYMECERITNDVAEYVGKRLINRKAKWAKDPVYQTRNRKLGVYVPDNPGYQYCVNNSAQILKNKYHSGYGSRFDYQLDVSRFPEQAARAVIQFKRDQVTTLVNACDTLSTRFLTEAANNQQWGPEWFIIGVATQDTDGAARTFNQSVVNGHLFGMSQFGQIKLIEGKQGEAFATWKRAFGNLAPPTGYGEAYYRILLMYTMLQAAGPELTPENIARGLRALPSSGGAHGAFGTWSFKTSHTATIDSREIYWVGNATGFDGKPGAYLETNGGKRFQSGQWPAAEPPVYPKK